MEVTSHVNSICNSVSYRIGRCLIDPGDEWEGFHDLNTVLLTHGHFDHIYGLNRVIELNPQVKIYTNEFGREMLLDARKNLSFYYEIPFVTSDNAHIVIVEDNEKIRISEELNIKAIFTPGHDPSCVTWLIGNQLFTGDSYIPGSKTVTKFSGGNIREAEISISLINGLSEGRNINPGHKT